MLLAGLRPIAESQKESALKHMFNYFNHNKDLLGKIKEPDVDVSVEKDDYIMTGKIDLLKGEEGKLEILDFKNPTRA